jgi:hypothetical protein
MLPHARTQSFIPHQSIRNNSFLSSFGSNASIDGQLQDYFRRLIDFKQMDFEAAIDQMIYLLSFEPEKAYVPNIIYLVLSIYY